MAPTVRTAHREPRTQPNQNRRSCGIRCMQGLPSRDRRPLWLVKGTHAANTGGSNSPNNYAKPCRPYATYATVQSTSTSTPNTACHGPSTTSDQSPEAATHTTPTIWHQHTGHATQPKKTVHTNRHQSRPPSTHHETGARTSEAMQDRWLRGRRTRQRLVLYPLSAVAKSRRSANSPFKMD